MSKKVLFKAKRIESLQDVVTRGSHRCPHCEKLFLSKFCLARHVRIHKEAEVKKFECIVCKKRFNEIANYLRHCMFHDMNRHISKGPSNDCVSPEECYECNRTAMTVPTLATSSEVQNHQQEVSHEKADSSGNPSFVTPKLENHQEELPRKNGTPRYPSFVNQTLENDLQESGQKNDMSTTPSFVAPVTIKIENDNLQESFQMQDTLNNPSFVAQNEIRNRQPEQPLKSNDSSSYENGEDSDDQQPGSFFCENCPKTYIDSESLIRHMNRVHKQGYKCTTCGAVLTSIQSYLQHKTTHDKKRYICQYCDRAFANKKSCTIHERVHTGEKPHICGTCNRAFTQSSHLADHVRTHSGERPFACNECSLAFTTHSSRRRHQRVVHRVGEQVAYPCSICGAVLSTRYSINLHMKRHGEGLKKVEKTFFCTDCDSVFSSSSTLRKHLRKKHDYAGRTSTMCTLCNVSYYSESTLKQHIMRVHNDVAAVPNEALDSISCDECGALMQTQSGILIHKRRCHGKSE